MIHLCSVSLIILRTAIVSLLISAGNLHSWFGNYSAVENWLSSPMFCQKWFTVNVLGGKCYKCSLIGKKFWKNWYLSHWCSEASYLPRIFWLRFRLIQILNMWMSKYIIIFKRHLIHILYLNWNYRTKALIFTYLF